MYGGESAGKLLSDKISEVISESHDIFRGVKNNSIESPAKTLLCRVHYLLLSFRPHVVSEPKKRFC